MNILQALIQLRNDIKQWATNNLVALDASKLNSADESDSLLISDEQGNVIFKVDADGVQTTDIKVSGYSVSTKITELEARPKFSGDYNDLTNKPNIADDGSDNLTIVDPNGNPIVRVDADGVHTTNIEAADIDTSGDNFAIADPYGNAIFKVDAQGAHTTALTLKGHPAATKIEVNGKAEELKKELGNALDSDSSQLRIVDPQGNIIFGVDALGAHTTDLRLKGKSVATQEYVDSKTSAFPKIPAWALAETKPVYTKSDVGLDKVNNTSDENKPISKATQQAIDNVKESIGYGIESDSASWLIVDANGYIAFRVDDWGTHVADLIIENKSLKETLASLENRISTLEKEV